MKTPTAWSDPIKKLKPINLQAALICRKVKPEFQPLPEPTKNVLAEREAEAKERKLKAEQAAQSLAEHYAEQERQREEHRQMQKQIKRNKKPKMMWAAKYAKKRPGNRGSRMTPQQASEFHKETLKKGFMI